MLWLFVVVVVLPLVVSVVLCVVVVVVWSRSLVSFSCFGCSHVSGCRGSFDSCGGGDLCC